MSGRQRLCLRVMRDEVHWPAVVRLVVLLAVLMLVLAGAVQADGAHIQAMLVPVGKVLVWIPQGGGSGQPAPMWLVWITIGVCVLCVLLLLYMIVGDLTGWW